MIENQKWNTAPTLFNIMDKICLEIEKEKNNRKILVYAVDLMLWTNYAED